MKCNLRSLHWLLFPLLLSLACAVADQRLCKLCLKPLLKDQAATMMTANGERRSFRCVHCALTDSLNYSWDLTIEIASDGETQDIWLNRKKGKWTASPETTVFLVMPEVGGECTDKHRAFPNRQELDAYLIVHPHLQEAKPEPFTINRIAEVIQAGKEPQETD